MVNSKFPARFGFDANVACETVSRITTLCPVPQAAHDNVIKWMLERNIKVQIYTNDPQKPVKVYYVGGPTTDGEGTYTILEEDGKMQSRPFITYLPGLHGYLSPRFNTDRRGMAERRNCLLIRRTKFNRYRLEYPYKENNSFMIKRVDKDSFMLQPGDDKYKINESYQQKYIHQYLDFYSSISFEAFDNKNTEKDSIIRTKPYCIIQVTGTDNKVNKVQLFYMAIGQRTKVSFDIKGKEITHDVDHFYGLINGGNDFVLTQYYVLGKILRNYKDFYFKPKAEGAQNPAKLVEIWRFIGVLL